jgi:hypothetical protein
MATSPKLAAKPQNEKPDRQQQHITECHGKEDEEGRLVHQGLRMLSFGDSETRNSLCTMAEQKKMKDVAQSPQASSIYLQCGHRLNDECCGIPT